ncbi:dynein light chain Tctex-type protein 2B-like [Glandiceps talaboti]
MSDRRNSVSSRRSSVQIDPKDGPGVILQTGPSSQDDGESGTYSSIKMAKPNVGIASIAALRRFSRRTSMAGFGRSILKNKPKLENTYKMDPDRNVKFNATRVERMLDSVLCSNLDDVKYDAKTASTLAATIADTAKRQTKIMGFERHKFVTHVVIGNIYDQDASVTSRCLWDSRNDDFASAYYRNASLFAVATVFAVYFE